MPLFKKTPKQNCLHPRIGGKSIGAHTIPQQPIFNDCAQLRFDDFVYDILRFENKNSK